jgi:hypothetical protein
MLLRDDAEKVRIVRGGMEENGFTDRPQTGVSPLAGSAMAMEPIALGKTSTACKTNRPRPVPSTTKPLPKPL